MIVTEEDYLAHYGTLRKSGRYPWGSGGTQSARNRSFLDTIAELKRQGLSEKQIVEGFSTETHPMTIKQLRALKSKALADEKLDRIATAEKLRDKGMGYSAIGRQMGINESSVRSLLADGAKDKANAIQTTVAMLKDQVAQKELIDVGVGVHHSLGISKDRLDTAVISLQEEGYGVHYPRVPQVNTGELTTVKVLSKPGVHTRDVYKNLDQIQQIQAYSDNRGSSYIPLRDVQSVSSKRVAVRYAEEGGAKADGVIFVRPGAKDMDLGQSRYAQVRIAVDKTHYLKGMAVYKDDLPDGVDLMFNTNKTSTGNKKDAMKPIEKDKDGLVDWKNPFGSAIKPGGQRGVFNIVNEEGDWKNWSENLSSQFLSKQSPALIKTQLDLTHTQRKADLQEIMSLTNPAVKRKLLESFADDADSASVHLKAAVLPGTSNHVILPLKTIKDTEVYAPNFHDGERVVLIRHPHGGTFEIPELTVNNRNREGKKLMGVNTPDAIGISAKVAERLSGADFDGDSVLVIKNNRGSVKSDPPLEGLKNFNPQKYKIKEGSGVARVSKDLKEIEMGKASNLITDMTIRGASHEDMARAVRHSMVVIDSEKHGLDIKRSAEEHGISALKAKYQGGPTKGASTLLSRSGATTYVDQRKLRKASQGGPIDKETGKLVFVETGRHFTTTDKKTGKEKVVYNKTSIKRGALTDDAHTLSSGTVRETLYADHSNRLKSLANVARLELVNTPTPKVDKAAKKVYATEVASLNSKLNVALRNAPLERQAQLIAHTVTVTKKQANPNMDKEDIKKAERQALAEARVRTGAQKHRVVITKDEWNAIQAGALSNDKLEQILRNSDLSVVRKMAMPRTNTVMTSAYQARAKAMLRSGYTQAEIASSLGVPVSTIMSSIGGE